MVQETTDDETLKERTTRKISNGRVRIPPEWLRDMDEPEGTTMDRVELDDGSTEVRLRFD